MHCCGRSNCACASSSAKHLARAQHRLDRAQQRLAKHTHFSVTPAPAASTASVVVATSPASQLIATQIAMQHSSPVVVHAHSSPKSVRRFEKRAAKLAGAAAIHNQVMASHAPPPQASSSQLYVVPPLIGSEYGDDDVYVRQAAPAAWAPYHQQAYQPHAQPHLQVGSMQYENMPPPPSYKPIDGKKLSSPYKHPLM
ncbi:hypothetical protein HDU96_005732 [Phlyctochytrium bullatum]|nr:hypothetical protein HDU96_005732 [Phlyctochytrium bullatum]